MSLDYKTDVEYNYSRRDALVTGGKVVLGAVGALLGLDFLAGCDDNSSRQSGLRVSGTSRGNRIGGTQQVENGDIEHTVQAEEQHTAEQNDPSRNVEQSPEDVVRKAYRLGADLEIDINDRMRGISQEYSRLFVDIERAPFFPPRVPKLLRYEITGSRRYSQNEASVDVVEFDKEFPDQVGARTRYFLRMNYGEWKIDKMEKPRS